VLDRRRSPIKVRLYGERLQAAGSSGELCRALSGRGEERAERTLVRERAPQPGAEPDEMRRQQACAV